MDDGLRLRSEAIEEEAILDGEVRGWTVDAELGRLLLRLLSCLFS